MRYYGLILFGLLFVTPATGSSRPLPAQGGLPANPNIVVLFADDLGYGDLGSYGNPVTNTPAIDSLAESGVRFTSFYVAAPSCTPSRAGLLTGRYPQRVGLPNVLGPDSTLGLAPEEETLAEVLKGEGYRTKMVGKWHLGHARPEFMPTSHGFDSYFGLLYSNDMIPPWVQTDRPLHLYRDLAPIEGAVDQSTLTRRYTEEALSFLNAEQDEPFFLYLAYSMPHVPIFPAAHIAGRSRGGVYGDVIETIDWSVSEILAALSRLGVRERTIVVFASDNGPWLNMPERMFREGIVQPWHAGSPGPLRGAKGTTWEGGMRVPGMVSWPGTLSPSVTAEPVSTLDLFPTLARWAGAHPSNPEKLDGRDLTPFLLDGIVPEEFDFFYLVGETLQGIRRGPWKLRAENLDWQGLGLFHLDSDPAERYDRSDEFPEIVADLKSRMLAFLGTLPSQERTGGSAPQN